MDNAANVARLRQEAEAGDIDAAAKLGYCYDVGFAVTQDDAKAIEWYRKAAVEGHPVAQFNYAVKYELGRGIKRDLTEAFAWYKEAAEHGLEQARSRIEAFQAGHGGEFVPDPIVPESKASETDYAAMIRANVSSGRGSNWDAAFKIQARAPHTFAAMQKLIMAMADASKHAGKQTLFGRDKGLIAYKKYEASLKDTLLALTLDGLVKRGESADDFREAVLSMVAIWSEVFPTWPDAYEFAISQLVLREDDARGLIHALVGARLERG